MKVENAFESRYVKIWDLQYEEGKHYMNASRRSLDNLVATKSTEEFKKMLPDAVSMVVILNIKGQSPKLLLDKEFRYPANQYLLSVPAGLLDPEDALEAEPLLATAKREIMEECGIEMDERDTLKVINPLLFSTPGMTDESNGIVLAVINRDEMPGMTQDGALGLEKFDGFNLLDEAEAKRILLQGRDDDGIFYSVFTWIGLTTFATGLWRDFL